MISPQPLQRMFARAAQFASQRLAVWSQHSGSEEHTDAQHAASEQPGPWCSTKQLPVAVEQTALIAGSGLSEQIAAAACTQVKSQLALQQKSSK